MNYMMIMQCLLCDDDEEDGDAGCRIQDDHIISTNKGDDWMNIMTLR